MTEAVREKAHQHRCVCILGHNNACFVTITSPDQPFCVSCEHDGHHEQEQQMDPQIRQSVEEAWRTMHQGGTNATGE